MEVEVQASPLPSREIPLSTELSRFRSVHSENAQEESHRKDQVSQISESALHSTKEGLFRQKNHPGPVITERIHHQGFIQNANHTTSQASSSKRGLDCKSGFEGWLLAPQHSEDLQTLPGLPLQRPELALQSHALRTLYSSPNIHQTDQVRGAPAGEGRHMVPPVPRRSTDHCILKRGMSTESPEDCGDPPELGMADKLGEIQNRTQSELRMAGSSIQSDRSYNFEFGPDIRTVQTAAEGVLRRRLLHQTESYEAPGTGQLVGPDRSPFKDHPLSHENYPKTPSKSPIRCQTTDGLPDQESSREMAVSPQFYPDLRSTKSFNNSSNRCLPVGIWHQDKRSAFSRKIPHFDEELLHKCPRTTDGMVGLSLDTGEESGSKNSDRQFNSNRCNKESVFDNLPSHRVNRTYLEESNLDELDLNSSSHRREVQCDSGSTVSQHSNLYGVVSSTSTLQADDSNPRAKVRSRSVCDKLKQPARSVCLTLPRCESSSSERLNNRLEQMAIPLPVPSSPNDFEGFSEADPFRSRKSHFLNTRRDNETVVFSSKIASISFINNRGKTATTGRKQARRGHKYFQASRVGVLKEACSEEFPDCDQQTLDLMTRSVKMSSEADYQRKWESYILFTKGKGVDFDDINTDIVLRFLSFLFYTKGLKPSTVCHYRSALARPLLAYFNIDLRRPEVNAMLRAMKIQRPNEPSPRPAWKLSKVLSYLDSLDTSSETNSLRKTAFLLLLATGWRISEIHACVRNQEFLRFTESHNVLLQPHSSFLAKNGLRKRLEPKEIRVLKLQDGQISNICPVEALKEYLKFTSKNEEGPLFLNPRDGSLLSIFQLRYHICSMITEADPDTKAKVHDIRKYAASCSLQQDMLVGDLTEDFNWSTPAIFYKFYFLQTDILNMPVSLPVRS